MALLSTVSIVFLVLFIIFLILTAVFIGLYIRARGLYTNCSVQLSGFTCPACPSCPAVTGTTNCPNCPVCPNVSGMFSFTAGTINSFVTGTVKGQTVTLTCPVNTVIDQYQLLTTMVDSKTNCVPTEDLSAYIQPQGYNTYTVSSSSILKQAGIDPATKYNAKHDVYPTKVLYGSFTCVPGTPLVQTPPNACPPPPQPEACPKNKKKYKPFIPLSSSSSSW